MAAGEALRREIPLAVPHFGPRELEALGEAISSGWVSTASPDVGRFEEAFAAAVGAPHAVALVSGTAALHMALLVAGVQPGDEVLLPALTFVAPANAVRHAGAQPVFVDVDPVTAQLDVPAALELLRGRFAPGRDGLVNIASGRRLAALLPVHVLGHACDVTELVAFARDHGVPVIEDATEGLGATLHGTPLGLLGDIGCFSFNGNKLLTTGGGGMLVTGCHEWAARARYLTQQAKEPGVEYVHGDVGYNTRLPGLQAVLGIAQLASLSEHLAAKRRVAAAYLAGLADLPGVQPLLPGPGVESAWWLFTIIINELAAGLDSRALLAGLAAAGIQSRPLWQPLPESRAYLDCEALPWEASRLFHRRGLSLPSSVGLTPADQARVVKVVRALVAGATA